MRFSIIAAFILPLAALAAPTPTPNPVDVARAQFADAITSTIGSVNATITLLKVTSKQPIVREDVREDALGKACQASKKLELAFEAADRIAIALKAKEQPAESEYVDNLCVYEGQMINMAFALAANSRSHRTP